MAVPGPFLTAQWRHLLMLNYDVEAAILEPFVPAGTELDLWHGRAVISLVGFRFLDTRLKGWAIPWHRNFTEVNLRFYVRRRTGAGWRRGVVFLKEIADKFAVTCVANNIYHENYVTLPMTQRIQVPASATDRTGFAAYRWKHRGSPFEMSARFAGLPQRPASGSEEEFIVEHYWGYTRLRTGATAEYEVRHPAWRVWPAQRATFTGDATELYGRDFAAAISEPPRSALVADGSAVTVFSGARLREEAQRFYEASRNTRVTRAAPRAGCRADRDGRGVA
jgi:uncharacterized protein YqjF (DUF2071 family)